MPPNVVVRNRAKQTEILNDLMKDRKESDPSPIEESPDEIQARIDRIFHGEPAKEEAPNDTDSPFAKAMMHENPEMPACQSVPFPELNGVIGSQEDAKIVAESPDGSDVSLFDKPNEEVGKLMIQDGINHAINQAEVPVSENPQILPWLRVSTYEDTDSESESE